MSLDAWLLGHDTPAHDGLPAPPQRRSDARERRQQPGRSGRRRPRVPVHRPCGRGRHPTGRRRHPAAGHRPPAGPPVPARAMDRRAPARRRHRVDEPGALLGDRTDRARARGDPGVPGPARGGPHGLEDEGGCAHRDRCRHRGLRARPARRLERCPGHRAGGARRRLLGRLHRAQPGRRDAPPGIAGTSRGDLGRGTRLPAVAGDAGRRRQLDDAAVALRNGRRHPRVGGPVCHGPDHPARRPATAVRVSSRARSPASPPSRDCCCCPRSRRRTSGPGWPSSRARTCWPSPSPISDDAQPLVPTPA